ncbi:MAG: discoidin domain-containing protein, partial [Prevotellaceae bacterium]|nr:discoidin domain-containing protein [Prevotellaceae bacterium]
FLVDDDDSIRIFEPDTANLWQLSVTEIFPADDTYSERMINGLIEGANQSDFSDATVLYTIKDANGARFSTAKIRNTGRFRYLRYVSPEKSNCNVAEIMFYNDKGDKLGGKPIGTPGAYNNSNMTFDKAFDGDISTFYDALSDSDSWTGLDLGEAQTISEIRYLPRNEGNGIYEGHTYELYCWSDTDRQRLKRQTAPLSPPMYFRVPTNALLYIKNATTGKSGRWFTVNRNGEQEWI